MPQTENIQEELNDYAVYMKEITKVFPRVVANDRVTFKVKKGEIHALIGENGAGKTTLMNQLYGLYQPTSGEIYIKGKKVDIKGPSDAIDNGIGMVHQHFMLVENLSVAENVVLGSEPKRGITFNFKKAKKDVKELSEKYGLKVDVEAKIEDIPVGMQQRVEIIKTLYRGADILILDEPTAVLTPQETQELFEILRSLRKDGKTIIFISHKLKEVLEISDNITVMRLGKVTGNVKTSDTNETELANMMVGREVVLSIDRPRIEPGEVLVKVENLWIKDNRKLDAVRGLNFEVRKNQILGIAGVAGNGQSELAEALTGLRKIESGKFYFQGKEVTNLSVKELRELGIAHVPEDRQKRGMVHEFPNYFNLILGSHDKPQFSERGFLKLDDIRDFSKDLIEKFDVRPPEIDIYTGNLSGGNQQKVIIAREIGTSPKFIVVSQPTRGLDVGAIEYVHKELIHLRQEGVAILLISMELEEILSLSDRIMVMYEGKSMGEFENGQLTIEEIGLMMAGKSLDEVKLMEEAGEIKSL
ncbi:heme ABC transporter ATP-binding protein [Petrotoga mexicana DSM 14811]|uniref:Heme ABC transporter ATP-binding protein n=2 Tax=Petrotoga TaxID=28236 RepID=A0A2K1P4S1_9BACT|nr:MULTISPECIES: ABC transporter ATP-binding protein [Petrotoga]PNR97785.1 heme ABC transporter ATP-binding protein [Petrotoga mexicana DSM 14811]PNR99657.1 heme ABC transporter ATP-binding protein [Petrotoga miotherma DSM 10691]